MWGRFAAPGSEDAPRGRKGARLRRRLCRRVVFASLKGRRPFGPRVVDCRSAAMLMKSVLRDLLSVSYGMKNILLTGSLRSPPPIRLCRTSPYAGGRIKHRETIFSSILRSR